ncbi:MAG: hypothetical protein AAF439_00905 [Pseudomonadota bacterium]
MRILVAILLGAMLMGVPQAMADDDRAKLRIELQASMQRHIDRSTIQGAFMSINLESGDMIKYFPTKAHTAVLEGDGYYVLCADMRDEAGESVPVDYYLTKARRGFKVFRTEIANRGPLKALMKAGEVKKF